MSVTAWAVTLAVATIAGCAPDEPADGTVTVSGTAFAFALPGTPYGLIDGGTVSVLEAPELSTLTDAEGIFELAGIPGGTEATFVIESEGFPVTHTKTFSLPGAGAVERVTFQVPDNTLYDALASLLTVDLDPERCQIVTTVTRVGKSLYDEGAHGEAGATVSISPAGHAETGPIYFGEDVIPNPDLTETSEDGGVLFTNVEPGTYVLSASKPGVDFEDVTMECVGGVLVNASPPHGLQAR